MAPTVKLYNVQVVVATGNYADQLNAFAAYCEVANITRRLKVNEAEKIIS